MSVKFLYSSVFGRTVLKCLMHSHALNLAGAVCHSKISKPFIKKYIKNNNINMDEFEGQTYDSFADFFGRTREKNSFIEEPKALISPCDGLVTIFEIKDGINLPIKESLYKVSDLIPDEEIANMYSDGLCVIVRLCASDYHHFCYIDNCYHNEAHFIPGLLHSVQPIACDSVPVYRINRRKWSLMETENFGTVAQIEVGALLVGGMIHENENGRVAAKRGDEMGKFDLAGSTICLLFDKTTKEKLELMPEYLKSVDGKEEVRIRMGEAFGYIK